VVQVEVACLPGRSAALQNKWQLLLPLLLEVLPRYFTWIWCA
jgi:hypothetical protein